MCQVSVTLLLLSHIQIDCKELILVFSLILPFVGFFFVFLGSHGSFCFIPLANLGEQCYKEERLPYENAILYHMNTEKKKTKPTTQRYKV